MATFSPQMSCFSTAFLQLGAAGTYSTATSTSCYPTVAPLAHSNAIEYHKDYVTPPTVNQTPVENKYIEAVKAASADSLHFVRYASPESSASVISEPEISVVVEKEHSLIPRSVPVPSATAAPCSHELIPGSQNSFPTGLASVYTAQDLSAPSLKPATAVNGHNYLGCYVDQASNGQYRTFQQAETTSLVMTTSFCGSFCHDFKFYGLQYGKECFCSNSDLHAAVGASESECNVPCAGDAGSMCGGNWRLSVYQNPEDTEGTIAGTNTSPSYSSVNSISLQVMQSTPKPSTVSNQSSMSNSGQSPSLTTNQLIPVSTPNPDMLDGFVYDTCAIEPASSYDGGGVFGTRPDLTSDAMTPKTCASLCCSHKYFGIRKGKECFCGDEIMPLASHTNPGACNTPCSGDHDTFCGANHLLSFYRKEELTSPFFAFGSFVDTPASTPSLEASFTYASTLATPTPDPTTVIKTQNQTIVTTIKMSVPPLTLVTVQNQTVLTTLRLPMRPTTLIETVRQNVTLPTSIKTVVSTEPASRVIKTLLQTQSPTTVVKTIVHTKSITEISERRATINEPTTVIKTRNHTVKEPKTKVTTLIQTKHDTVMLDAPTQPPVTIVRTVQHTLPREGASTILKTKLQTVVIKPSIQPHSPLVHTIDHTLKPKVKTVVDTKLVTSVKVLTIPPHVESKSEGHEQTTTLLPRPVVTETLRTTVTIPVNFGTDSHAETVAVETKRITRTIAFPQGTTTVLVPAKVETKVETRLATSKAAVVPVAFGTKPVAEPFVVETRRVTRTVTFAQGTTTVVVPAAVETRALTSTAAAYDCMECDGPV